MSTLQTILLCVLVVNLLLIYIDKKVTQIKFRSREREFKLKYPIISSIAKFFIEYILIISLFTLIIIQEKTKLIEIPISNNPIVLTLTIYTMYGIFASFIQFLINYSSTNSRDFYWGKSKTKLILMDSIEYRIFNSMLFRILLLYLLLYSVLNISKIQSSSIFYSYADALFSVAITITILEFILLFIKALLISNVLFKVQEDADKIKRYIRKYIINEYQVLFNKSIQSKEYNFVKMLFSDVSNVEKAQREQMLYLVLSQVYSGYNWIWENQDNKITVYIEKFFTSFKKYNSNFKIQRLKEINVEFWYAYEQSRLELPLEKLLEIYTKQENLMYSLIKKESDNDKEKFSSMFEKVYKSSNYLSDGFEFFAFPEMICKTISSSEDLILLCTSARRLDMMIMFYRSIDDRDYECNEVLRDEIIEQYAIFICNILKNNKVQILQMNTSEVKRLLDITNWIDPANFKKLRSDKVKFYDFRTVLEEAIQFKLLNYLNEMENDEVNKQYIRKISGFMELKYIMFFICYRILYTGPDYFKWKGEILFFKELISSRLYEDNVFEKKNVNFVAEAIVDQNVSNIGHRISSELILWIFDNINSEINENIIKECSRKPYLSLAIFISFKYIFKESHFGYHRLDGINPLEDEIRIQLICEISKIKGVMEESYFIETLYNIFDYRKNKIDINKLIHKGNFEAFITVSNLIDMKELVEYINGNTGTDEFNKFLLIKFSEFNSPNLLSSLTVKAQQDLAYQYDKMLSQSLQTIDEYIDGLFIRLSALGYELPKHRKDIALNLLRSLVMTGVIERRALGSESRNGSIL